MANKERNIKCSFCGRPQSAVGRVIAGPGVFICNECIKLCNSILEEDEYDEYDESYTIKSKQNKELPKPA